MNNNNISIEKFAAYLDGNLPEAEMQHVASIIDDSPMLSSVLSSSIDIDTASEAISSEEIPSSLLSMDFPLPDVPETMVELNVSDDKPVLYAARDAEDVHLSVADGHTDTQALASEGENTIIAPTSTDSEICDSPLDDSDETIDIDLA